MKRRWIFFLILMLSCKLFGHQVALAFSTSNLVEFEDAAAGMVFHNTRASILFSAEMSSEWNLTLSGDYLFALWQTEPPYPSVFIGPGLAIYAGSFSATDIVDLTELNARIELLARIYLPLTRKTNSIIHLYADSALEAGIASTKQDNSSTVHLTGHFQLSHRSGIGIEFRFPQQKSGGGQ